MISALSWQSNDEEFNFKSSKCNIDKTTIEIDYETMAGFLL